MAQSGANDLATKINHNNRFAYIENLDLNQQPELHHWLAKNGLSQTEAALIPPMALTPITSNLSQCSTLYNK